MASQVEAVEAVFAAASRMRALYDANSESILNLLASNPPKPRVATI